MPRVKAITTGSVPSFLDVILNFAESDTTSTLAHQDTWLAQIKRRPGGRLIMYGDDTWLKLFPGMFDRHDGTTSFFVSDFVEVDNNVTRHVPEELQNDDWSAMIMHYLGLDHIGHKAGPFSLMRASPYMIPKQREMDSIVKQIYTAMEKQDHLASTVLVLCGDHGMNDAGNHGGASPGETSAALTFISPKFRQTQPGKISPSVASEDLNFYDVVEQSDIAPTLAGLLGFPIPLNNLGVFIPEFLSLWPQGLERLHLLLDNGRQILNVVKATYPKFNEHSALYCGERTLATDLSNLECQWQKASQLFQEAKADLTLLPDAETSLIEFCRAAQRIMSNASSNYTVTRLYQGTAVAFMAVLLSLISIFKFSLKLTRDMKYFLLVVAGYSSLMFASSYVEEEQQFWYWALTGWICYLYLRTCRRATSSFRFGSALCLAALSRIARRWNQTGQKFAAEPDIATTFFSNHPNILWILALFTYTDVYQRLKPLDLEGRKVNIASALYLPLTSFAFIFKAAFTSADAPELIRHTPLLSSLVGSVQSLSLLFQARFIFAGLCGALLYGAFAKFKASRGLQYRRRADWSSTFHAILSLFLLSQSRATNVPLFGIFQLQYDLLLSMSLSHSEIAITSLLMQYTAFFALGGSNAISSIDLSNAYNGIGSYNVVLVGILTFVGNWAGPIWWVSATQCMLRMKNQNLKTPGDIHLQLWTLFTATSLLAVMVACTVLRAHLFIWTVFSPKFLYSAAWALGHHVVVNILFGEGLLRLLYN
ncbi:major facilitator super transporter protein [Coccidioides posadasii str. Silveira]|uniref:major facilitator superfamily transporter protein n=1 Tax=Coccidioides posadasii (strain RMSCC 757 / Silveira) TaxID=443226 RepID=UPI001BF0EED6|nr:major facilitator super transporter protein [Coccidioides posadasii str. Silveira]